MPERREKMAPVVGDDHRGARRARHLGNVRVVDAASGNPFLNERRQERAALVLGKVVDGHSSEDLLLEKASCIGRRHAKLRRQPRGHRIHLETTVPGRGGCKSSNRYAVQNLLGGSTLRPEVDEAGEQDACVEEDLCLCAGGSSSTSAATSIAGRAS